MLSIEFLEEMNLSDSDLLTRAVAVELLKQTIIANESYRELNVTDFYPSDISENSLLLRVLDAAAYWSNDLADALVESLVEYKIESPLNCKEPFKVIFDFLDKKIKEI